MTASMKDRGQTLVLLALTMLLLTLMVLMTLSIGTAAARKADLANAADAAAYSTAVATARSFNTGALLNRTMVSHYVSMAGLQAQMVYSSTVHNYFNLAGVMFRLYDDGDSSGDGTVDYVDSHTEPTKLTGCGLRTTEVRDASYEMWHVALRGLRPPNGINPPDQVDAQCRGGGCARPRPWLEENEAVLEEAVTKQSKAVHEAIWDLARIQRATYRNLERAVKRGTWASQIATAARVGSRNVEGQDLGEAELDGATANSGNALSTPPITFQRPFAEAILGTRRRREPLLLPTVPENLPPMVTEMKRITDAAFAVYPRQPFRVDFGVTETSVDFAYQDQARQMTEDPLIAGEPTRTDLNELFPSLKNVHARSVNGRVVTFYKDTSSCGTGQTIRLTSGQRSYNPASRRWVDLTQNGNMSTFIRSAVGDPNDPAAGGKHINYGSSHLDGIHWRLFASGSLTGGCHGDHQHYLATDEDVHDLEEDLLPKDVLAFALPDSDDRIDEKGARGAWGQPVLPVMFTQRYRAQNDPFNLNVGFKFSSGAGARFDMRKAVDTALAPAAAMAYYHRRGHLGEPPNLLNPFWHATLVPIEIDERKDTVRGGGPYDPTEDSQGAPTRMKTLIDAAYSGNRGRDAYDAYRGLRNHITGLSKPVAANDR